MIELKDARKKEQILPETLAKAAGMTLNTYLEKEKEPSEFTFSEARAIADALHYEDMSVIDWSRGIEEESARRLPSLEG